MKNCGGPLYPRTFYPCSTICISKIFKKCDTISRIKASWNRRNTWFSYRKTTVNLYVFFYLISLKFYIIIQFIFAISLVIFLHNTSILYVIIKSFLLCPSKYLLFCQWNMFLWNIYKNRTLQILSIKIGIKLVLVTILCIIIHYNNNCVKINECIKKKRIAW